MPESYQLEMATSGNSEEQKGQTGEGDSPPELTGKMKLDQTKIKMKKGNHFSINLTVSKFQ